MKKDPLYEVIFDVATTLDRYLNNLVEDERDTIMDGLEGSRGLCHSCVIPWAHEFEKTWTERGDEDIDYMIAVDEFAQKKFDELRKEYLRTVVGVQVVPVIHFPRTETQNEHAEPQFGGPTTDTTCWAVYTRGTNGLARWIADFDKEDHAMRFGAMLAAQHDVSIEPQLWKQPPKQAEVVVKDTPEERFHVTWTIDVDAATARDAALKAREIQLRPGSIATVFDVRDDSSDLAVRVDLHQPE